MSDKDPLATFNFDQVTGPSLYLKFKADEAVKIRVLTIDPVVYTQTYEDKKTDEVNVNTKFAFTVYNFTANKAQVLQATPAMARKIGEIHNDPDFGSNIRKIDIKITPTGERLERRYDLQVLPNTETLTNSQIEEAKKIDLEELIGKSDNAGVVQRMSTYNSTDFKQQQEEGQEEVAREVGSHVDRDKDSVDDELINLDDIPF